MLAPLDSFGIDQVFQVPPGATASTASDIDVLSEFSVPPRMTVMMVNDGDQRLHTIKRLFHGYVVDTGFIQPEVESRGVMAQP